MSSPNAMWNYDPFNNKYRWVAGDKNTSVNSLNFGQLGVPSPDVYPGQLQWVASTIDGSDNIWLYGGYDSSDGLSSFFFFNTSSLEFTWLGGNASNTDHVTGKQGAPSPNVWPGALQGACLKADSKGNLWLLGGYQGFSTNRVWHYNVTSRLWTFISSNDTAQITTDYQDPQWNGRWDAACTIDTDDRVWMFGGYGYGPNGENSNDWADLWSFNTKSMTWSLEVGNATSFQYRGSVVSTSQFSPKNLPSAR